MTQKMRGTIIVKNKVTHVMKQSYTGDISRSERGYLIHCNENGRKERHIIPDNNIAIINLIDGVKTCQE